MGGWDQSYDFVIVGSGGGSFAAALAAKSHDKSVLIIEKLSKVGGSTGFSGGVLWVPNNPLLARHGVHDSYDRAKTYFDAVVTYNGPATTPARREAFLKTGPEMVTFLEQRGMVFRYPDGWSDYYDELPGGEPRGRSLMAPLFDIKELGEWESKLSTYRPTDVLPMGSDEYPTLFLMKRTLAGKLKALKLARTAIGAKLTGKHLRANGGALQGRMLKLVLKAGIDILTETPVTELVAENGHVTGVVITPAGGTRRIEARHGVLINAGGFSHNLAMRETYQPKPASTRTNANPGDTGEMIQAMQALGAAVDCMDEAWWALTSINADGSWPPGVVAKDGKIFPSIHHLDLSLPYLIMVDQDGNRFADESGAYMEIGQRMYQRQKQTGRAIPAWVIMDARNRKFYPWGAASPGTIPKEWLSSGYMKTAATLGELAEICRIDPSGLARTVERFNGFCRTGVDEDFNRGGRAFDRAHGDATVKPNPNLGPIEQGPFYAVAMVPGDVGTAGGVVTDEFARVLRSDGGVIEGLYATGNCTASVVGRCYPAAGASIGASFVFGYIAAHHALNASGSLPFASATPVSAAA